VNSEEEIGVAGGGRKKSEREGNGNSVDVANDVIDKKRHGKAPIPRYSR